MMKILIQQYADPRYSILQNRISAISTMLIGRNKVKDSPADNSGENYVGKNFSIRAYHWGDCDCEPTVEDHMDDEKHESEIHNVGCPVVAPNFESGDLKVWWYKRIGRAMDFTDVPIKEMHSILNAVEKEIVND